MEATVLCDIGKKHRHPVRKYLTLLDIFALRKMNLIFLFMFMWCFGGLNMLHQQTLFRDHGQLYYQPAVLYWLAAQLSACSERLGALCCVHHSCRKGYLFISNRWQHTAKRCLHSVRFGNDGLWDQGEIIVSFQLHVCGKHAMCRTTCRGQQLPTVLSA